MSDYTPDKWLGVKITGRPSEKPVYKIFACWYGGYLGSDSWKLNSGITSICENTDYYFFEGSSGSTYSAKLYDDGNTIIYWTARGTLTQINWFEKTMKQLTKWNCKFNELRMGKPAYDLFIDDKNINSDEYFNYLG